ncbi:MAG TPA: lysylphosphatidylglycerol synthase transmembrane domain-containing protein [Candidatus Limnocylindrales bacterium]|nr:lysylphosphatidylglycerol synthase transmembrane domain-containing protein [Candidatus Limnocylindrales bacterium]
MDSQNNPLNPAFISLVRPTLQLIKQASGYLFAFVCLVWVLRGFRFNEFLKSIPTIRWRWVLLAIMLDILSYLCQGLRWQFLLRPVGTLSIWQATQAIYTGLFINEILPMRLGELVRAYLVSRWLSVVFSSVIPSLVMERLLDGIWLIITLGLMTIFVPLPKDLLETAGLSAMLVLTVISPFIYVIFRKSAKTPTDKDRKISSNLSVNTLSLRCLITSFLGNLIHGLQNIGLSRFFYLALSLSFLVLSLQALVFWLVMWAYGLRLPFWVGAAVFLIVHLGTAIPTAPANVGTYQFFCMVGLTLFGVEKPLAAGFSMVVFILLTGPIWIIGFLAMSYSGTTWRTLRKEINKLPYNRENQVSSE